MLATALVLAATSLASPVLNRLAWLASHDPTAPGTEEVIRQGGRSDCGASALRMVFSHHGIEGASLDELETALQVRSDGTSLLALSQVAEERGLLSRGLRLNVQDLGNVPMPAIAHVHGNHFVVVRQAGEQMTVDDPEIGRLRMSAKTFDRAWSGIVLTFERMKGGVPTE